MGEEMRKITAAREMDSLIPGEGMDRIVAANIFPGEQWNPPFSIPHWSTNLESCWDILSEFPRYWVEKSGTIYTVRLGENEYSGMTGASDESLPMAICKSALLRRLKYEGEILVP